MAAVYWQTKLTSWTQLCIKELHTKSFHHSVFVFATEKKMYSLVSRKPCAGRLPMRKEIVWNVGMHSHPKCLNKLPMNEAVNNIPTETSTTLRQNECVAVLVSRLSYLHTRSQAPNRFDVKEVLAAACTLLLIHWAQYILQLPRRPVASKADFSHKP